MDNSEDMPIFFDRSGQRWLWAKLLGVAALLLIAFCISRIVPVLTDPVDLPSFTPSATVLPNVRESKSPAQIAYSLNREELPMIGAGPLLRVVKPITTPSGNHLAVDVYSGEVTKELTPEERTAFSNQPYAIERYGQTSGKRIALTFDDGPDPIYTPQLLDMLSRESASSSFFVTGGNITKYPDIAKRIVREGHVLGSHTLSHIDFDFNGDLRSSQEITQTQRIIRASIKRNPAYFRLPYGGDDDASIRDNMKGILEAQRLGYVVTAYHIDSSDWAFRQGERFVLPELDGTDKIILLHDSGGDRTQTLSYVSALITKAKAEGYQFVSLDNLYPRAEPLFAPVSPTPADYVTLAIAKSFLVWPHQLLFQLFVITVAFLLLGTVLNMMLATIQVYSPLVSRRDKNYRPLVTILVPAFNEEKVLSKTIGSILRSDYRPFEIIIIDDGSKDKTWEIIEHLIRTNHVYGIRQPTNMGKSAALNQGLHWARGEVIISIDADTIFMPYTLGRLVRHFQNPKVGAVAGVIKVGNIRNIITRWQSLEYIIGINIERTAQAFLRAILIVPGACSAWRRSAILEARGYSGATLAEDCDLTLAVRKAGYIIKQDLEAIAFTEAPMTLKALAKQRFRWTFGNIQSFWKHRDMILNRRYGWLGMFVLPRAIIGLVVQLLFAPILLFVTIGNVLAGEINTIIFYFIMTTTIYLIITIIGLIFVKGHWKHILALPAYRTIYTPMRTYILFGSFLTALKGAAVGWNKLTRTDTVRYGPTPLPEEAKVASAPVANVL